MLRSLHCVKLDAASLLHLASAVVGEFGRWLSAMRIRGAYVALTATILLLCGAGGLARGRWYAELSSCANKLRMIEGAKGSYGLEQRLALGAPVSGQQISPYLMKG